MVENLEKKFLDGFCEKIFYLGVGYGAGAAVAYNADGQIEASLISAGLGCLAGVLGIYYSISEKKNGN